MNMSLLRNMHIIQVNTMEIYEKRWEAIQKELQEKEADAFIVSGPGHNRYLSCAHVPFFGIVNKTIIPKEGEPIALAPTLEEFRAREECAIKNLRIFAPYKDIETYAEKPEIALEKVLKDELKARKILCDAPVKIEDIEEESSDFIDFLRSHKSPEEIRLTREAIRITKIGEEALHDLVKPGKKEIEIAAELDKIFRDNGAQANSFETIIAGGPNAAFSHFNSSQRVIEDTDTVICDFGVYYGGYTSDITRTFLMDNVSAEMREIYDLVDRSNKEAIKAISPGKTLRSLDERSREVFREVGIARNFVHSLGHGMGLEVHENVTSNPVSMTLLSDNPIEEGQLFTVEPGIYLPGKGGVRIEDDVYIDEDGAVVLTR